MYYCCTTVQFSAPNCYWITITAF
uniref:Uncharacterized protein n=1 Tax=Arundo donax TaxID=35708 RepID=A0A0A8YFH7_ARUDO